ncbi:yippee zinc-binding/DNA-binding /Mis18, centromere assembly-domain-containing protein [Blastocladiella britannica]|nr:yippee zinc-binding/DNA-binding /Mis18, centromere assembly-domain-containing protein [Blastocladiella britannica]
MGQIHRLFLDEEDEYASNGVAKIYVCRACHTHLTRRTSVVSKLFQGRAGPAYLVTELKNVMYAPEESRLLMTGRHLVRDCSCKVCGETIGWWYIVASEESQKYKEGKFIVEKNKIQRWIEPPTSSAA